MARQMRLNTQQLEGAAARAPARSAVVQCDGSRAAAGMQAGQRASREQPWPQSGPTAPPAPGRGSWTAAAPPPARPASPGWPPSGPPGWHRCPPRCAPGRPCRAGPGREASEAAAAAAGGLGAAAAAIRGARTWIATARSWRPCRLHRARAASGQRGSSLGACWRLLAVPWMFSDCIERWLGR